MTDNRRRGTIFDIQSMSFHDGPGIRTLIFLKGCSLNCIWCANPEGKSALKEISYHGMNCTSCFVCIKACKKGAITEDLNADENGGIKIDRESCRMCSSFNCVEACSHNAVTASGKEASSDEIMRVIKRDRPYYRSNGGVTLSGGDPLYQYKFALEILKACKEEYINTAIESSMYAKQEIIEGVIPYTDLFLSDIKHMDSQKHRELTGVDNRLILDNIARAAKEKQVIVRIPVIPGLNDDRENIKAAASFCRANGITAINLLPYHKLGQVKYEQLGLSYGIKDITAPDTLMMKKLKEIVEENGVTCIIG